MAASRKAGAIATKVLDGWRLSERLRDKISFATSALYSTYRRRPGLAVIHVGDALEMERYVYAKKQLAHNLGVMFYEHQYPESTSTASLQQVIQELNDRNDVDGIIVQLPLPKHINSSLVLDTILPSKDVDGCHSTNQGLLYSGKFETLTNIPCAALAMVHFLQISFPCVRKRSPSSYAYSIPTKGKRAVIVGNSALVGYPCFCLLERMGSTCTIVHKDTPDVPSLTKEADIVVTATGNPLMIKGDWLKKGATVVDIGTRCVLDSTGKHVLVGDVDVPSCVGTAGAVTTVPGGVALLTTAMLMKNTVQAALRHEGLLNNSCNIISDASIFKTSTNVH